MLLTAGCFVLITLGVTSVAVVSRNYSRQGSRQTETLTRQFLPGLVALARLQDATLNLKSTAFQSALAKDEASMNAQKQAFQAHTEEVTRSIRDLTLLAPDPKTKRLIADLDTDVRAYREAAEKFQTALRSGEFERAMATLDQQIDPAQRKIETQLRALSEQYFQLSHDAGARTAALLAQSDRFGLAATLVLAGFTLLCLILTLAATRTLLAQFEKRESERQAAQATLEKRVEERTAALKLAQEDAAREQKRFKFIFESLPVGATWVLNGDDATRLCNPSFARISGVPVERCRIPRVYAEATHPEDWERQAALHRRMLAGEIDHYLIEKRFVHGDGSIGTAELTMRLFRDPATGETQQISTLVDLTERKRAQAELDRMHRQLLETSRQAGMAEVATSVLHNVGNVLNSVNISASLVKQHITQSKASTLPKLSALLQEHAGDLGHYLTHDPQGRKIPGYLAILATHLDEERQAASAEIDQLRKNIEHIKDIVAMQQTYAKVSGVAEEIALAELVEDALHMNNGTFERHEIALAREYRARPVVMTERHKILQILVNLIRNAKHACDDSPRTDKRIVVRLTQDGERIRIAIIDNGVGIPPENLTRIFSHGFTTRKDGHGFGLHASALAARELGGSLIVHSDGDGQGAAFTLELPLASGSASAGH